MLNAVSLPLRPSGPSMSGRDAPYRCLEGHTEWITSGVLLSDARTIATASTDTTIKFWKICDDDDDTHVEGNHSPSPCRATLYKHGDYVQSLSYCPWNQLLVSAGLNNELYSWRVDAPGAPRLISDLSGGGDGADAHVDGAVDQNEFDRLRGSFYATALSENGNTLLTGSSDHIVRLYDTRSSSPTQRDWLKLLGHTDNIRSVALEELVGTGVSMAYTASCDGSIKQWDLRMQRCVRSCTPGGHAHAARHIPSHLMCDVRDRVRRQQQLGSLRTTHPFDSLTRRDYSTHTHTTATRTHVAAPVSQPTGIWTMALDSTHSRVFTGGEGPIVWMTDLTSGHSEPIIRFRTNPAQEIASTVVNLTLDHRRDTLWAATWDGAVTGWDVKHCLQPETDDAAARSRTHQTNGKEDDLISTHIRTSNTDSVGPPSPTPLLMSTPVHVLPLAPLPPIEHFLALHDRVHVLATHFNNSAAFDEPGGDSEQDAAAVLVSTWNIVEGTCVDVARMPTTTTTSTAIGSSESAQLTLSTIASVLNAEFARLASSRAAASSSAAPPAPHKLVPSWCTLDARLGSLTISIDRRHCFAADASGWFRDNIARLQSAHQSSGVGSSDSSAIGRSRLHAHLMTPFAASARLNLGEVTIFNALTEWIWLEDRALREQTADGGRARDARLLRPVPPSSRWLAEFTLPDTVVHELATSKPILDAWTNSRTEPPPSARDLQYRHQRASSAITIDRMHAAPNTNAATPPGQSGPIITALSLIIAPPSQHPQAFLPLVCALPLTCGPDSGATSAAIEAARRTYHQLMPTWMDGIVFAPGTVSTVSPERECQPEVLAESSVESDEWIRRSKQRETAAATAVHSQRTGRRTFDSADNTLLTPPRVQSSRRSTTPAAVQDHVPPMRSGDLLTVGGPADAHHADSQMAPSTARASASPSQGRRSITLVASPRYAPQALSPPGPLLAAAAAAATATASQSNKIQFYLRPLPSHLTLPREALVPGAQRRLFTDEDESEFERDDAAEVHRDALRMGLDPADSATSSPPRTGDASPTVVSLPLVGSGSLIVPSGMTVRRIATYLCHRLWKDADTASLLPSEMRDEFDRQQKAARQRRDDEREVSAAREARTIDGPSPAQTPASLSSSTDLKSHHLIRVSPSRPHVGLASHNTLTPSAVNTIVVDSPSVNSRPSYTRLDTQMHLHATDTRTPPDAHAPFAHESPTQPTYAQPEHFLTLLLAHPALLVTPHVLAADAEIGSVREILWPKMRRAATNAPPLDSTSQVDTRRRSNHRFALPTDTSTTAPVNASAHPIGGDVALDAAVPNDAATSHLMTIYYTRSALGDEWYHREQRRVKESAVAHDDPDDEEPESEPVPTRPTPVSETSRRPHAHSFAGPSAAIPSVIAPIVPRIHAGIQTASNLRVAVPMVMRVDAIASYVSPRSTNGTTPSHSQRDLTPNTALGADARMRTDDRKDVKINRASWSLTNAPALAPAPAHVHTAPFVAARPPVISTAALNRHTPLPSVGLPISSPRRSPLSPMTTTDDALTQLSARVGGGSLGSQLTARDRVGGTTDSHARERLPLIGGGSATDDRASARARAHTHDRALESNMDSLRQPRGSTPRTPTGRTDLARK